MKKSKEVVNNTDCFAWLSNTKCNALRIKDCSKCSFYQHHSEVKDYQKYLPNEYQKKNK